MKKNGPYQISGDEEELAFSLIDNENITDIITLSLGKLQELVIGRPGMLQFMGIAESDTTE